MQGETKTLENIPKIGVGILGYGFATRAHIAALKRIREVYWPPPALPQCICICGRNEDNVRDAAARYEVKRWYTDWHKMLEDEEIHIFDNCGTNDVHAESCIEAAGKGLHILCEKPMARNSEEAGRMLEAVKASGVKHMCGFNYRFVPAVRLAKELIDRGVIGDIYHFYGRYAVDRAMDPEIPLRWIYLKSRAGSGALGALGSHLIDLARFLIGEPRSVMAMAKTFIRKRKKVDSDEWGEVDVDDAVSSLMEFENGAIGNFETSRFCSGRKNNQCFEINGSKGSIVFELEKMNRLQVYLKEEKIPHTTGFHDIIVTEKDHPLFKEWWPTGHTLGWDHTFIHEMKHFLDAIVNDKPVEPWGATLVDGYRNAVICDAMLLSAKTGKTVDIHY
ncbi:MAG: Gfo/Idh/MocA family oxidoreductase [Deltaproteobacteria bacterium]|nr:Gfo/Idh/MocA family oxidoreductase [Deltaproteobacteria bacterium]